LKQNLAAEALREIANIWKVDQTRVIETRDGFDWWPGDHKVSVSATRRTDRHVPETWMLSIKTDFLKNVPIEDHRFVNLASMASGVFGVTFAWVFPPAEIWKQHSRPGDRPRLWFANTAYLTAEDAGWLPRFLARMSILQPIQARMAAETSKMIGGGVPDASTSNLFGRLSSKLFARSQRHDVLDETLAEYAASGNLPNRWVASGEFETMAKGWRVRDDWTVDGDPNGFTLQLDLGGRPAVFRLSTHEKHPQLGNGLHCNLKLPIFERSKKIAEQCVAWNLRETFWTDIPQFGSWYPYSLPDDHACPQFTQFIPNALYGPGIANLALNWLFQRFHLAAYGEYPTPG
jgi:hypothetical protein